MSLRNRMFTDQARKKIIDAIKAQKKLKALQRLEESNQPNIEDLRKQKREITNDNSRSEKAEDIRKANEAFENNKREAEEQKRLQDEFERLAKLKKLEDEKIQSASDTNRELKDEAEALEKENTQVFDELNTLEKESKDLRDRISKLAFENNYTQEFNTAKQENEDLISKLTEVEYLCNVKQNSTDNITAETLKIQLQENVYNDMSLEFNNETELIEMNIENSIHVDKT